MGTMNMLLARDSPLHSHRYLASSAPWDVLSAFPFQRIPFKIAKNRLSDRMIELLTLWLNLCDKCHDNCSIKEPNSMPARLLSIAGQRLNSNVKLVRTKEHEGQYAALSYC